MTEPWLHQAQHEMNESKEQLKTALSMLGYTPVPIKQVQAHLRRAKRGIAVAELDLVAALAELARIQRDAAIVERTQAPLDASTTE